MQSADRGDCATTPCVVGRSSTLCWLTLPTVPRRRYRLSPPGLCLGTGPTCGAGRRCPARRNTANEVPRFPSGSLPTDKGDQGTACQATQPPTPSRNSRLTTFVLGEVVNEELERSAKAVRVRVSCASRGTCSGGGTCSGRGWLGCHPTHPHPVMAACLPSGWIEGLAV